MFGSRPELALCAALMLFGGCQSSMQPVHYDMVIKNGQVYDGSLRPPAVRSVGIRDGLIVSLDARDGDTADQIIDARDRLVVPGFIDPHTHSVNDLLNPSKRANENYLRQGVTTVFIGNDGDGVPYRSTRLERMAKTGIGTNVAFFAGHGHLRKQVMGLADRPPTNDELAQMTAMVNTAMRAGAVGLSTGLYYAPGSYATRNEVIALARAAANYGGVYDTHLRAEGTGTIGLEGAVDEAIDIARAANLPLHISHIKALGRDAWGRSAHVIEQIERAQASGVTITANQYPWQASGTRFSNALIPRWAMAGSKEAMHARLRDEALRPKLFAEMTTNMARRGGPDAMLITDARNAYVGQTLTEASRSMEMPIMDAAIELVINGDPSIASFVMSESDIVAFAVRPWVMTGSDGSRGHPRKYATYPKAYRDFVIDTPHMNMSRFVHRSSGLVADTFGLCDRGYLQENRRADVAIIDPQTFSPAATYKAPTLLSEGVEHLIVNGQPVIHNGTLVNSAAGQVIRRNRLACNHD